MSTSQCFCGSPLDCNNRLVEIHLSKDICDICGCYDYIRQREIGIANYNKVKSDYNPKLHKNGSRARSKKFKLGVFQFFVALVSNSSIGGISNCASAKTRIRKFLWLVVFLGCFSGYGYQTFNFYRKYRNNPTLVNLEVVNHGQVEFPAVTICNSNRFRKSEFCNYFPDQCNNSQANFSLPGSAISNVMLELLEEDDGYKRMELGHQSTMILNCNFYGYPYLSDKECKSILEKFFDPDFGNCYTIPGKNKDGLTLEAREGDFWQETNVMTILADTDPEEFMESNRQPGIFMTVHDESSLPDIHTDGLFLSPGFSYSVGVRKTTVLLLSSPYAMNCTKYEKLPWQRGYKRRLTSRMCTVRCSQYFQLRECRYVNRNLSLFYDKLPFEPNDVTEAARQCAESTEIRTLEYCRSLCGLPCRDVIFKKSTETTQITEKLISQYHLYYKKNRSKEIQESLVHAKVFYASFEHTIYRNMPKYDTLDIFSFLGGYSGIWLGFSLLTVYEMLEILYTTLMFAIHKCRKSRQAQKLIKTISCSKHHAKTTVRTIKRKKSYR